MAHVPRSAPGRTRTLGVLLAALALAAVSTGGCRRAPVDPVEALLAGLERATERRDADALVALLAEDFRGRSGLERPMVAAELRRYFALYEDVRVERAPAEVSAGADTVRVVVRVLFSAKPKLHAQLLRSESAPVRFELVCRRVGQELRLLAADWTEESAADAPATRSPH